jgi:hypothetical protein
MGNLLIWESEIGKYEFILTGIQTHDPKYSFLVELSFSVTPEDELDIFDRAVGCYLIELYIVRRGNKFHFFSPLETQLEQRI